MKFEKSLKYLKLGGGNGYKAMVPTPKRNLDRGWIPPQRKFRNYGNIEGHDET